MKNIKLIAPLALVACATLASCGGSTNPFTPLKRLDYKEVSATELTEVLHRHIRPSQVTVDAEGRIFHTKPSEKGTITFNYGVAATGKFKLFAPSIVPTIDLTGLKGGLADTITFSWEKDKIKISDSRSTSYVMKTSDHYIKYYDVDGKKYCVNIDPLIYGEDTSEKNETTIINYFDNYLMVEAARNLGVYIPRVTEIKDDDTGEHIAWNYMLEGAGFDLTGFGNYLTWDYNENPRIGEPGLRLYTLENVIAPGQYLSTGKIARLLPIIKAISGGYYKFGSNDEKSASINLGIKNFDLSILPGIIESLVGSRYSADIDASGTLSADYFVAYANNFIKQQEIIINANAAKLSGEVYLDKDKTQTPVLLGTADVALDLSLYLGQEVTDEASIEDINKEEYGDPIIIDPVDPALIR
ncbi:MAG: hypothetical protein MJ214_02795 [Bacilli bacterium]|nr:hypothetical protein [Bacilli bacterium]